MAKKRKHYNDELHAKKRHRRVNAFLIALLCCAIIFLIHCILQFMPLYGVWQYETRLNHLTLPTITEPTFVNIELKYMNKPPTDIEITVDGKSLIEYVIETDEINKTINVTYDSNELNANYELTLMPHDNYEITYSITTEPSMLYMISKIEPYTAANGDRWVAITGSYDQLPDAPISVFASLEGKTGERYGYRPTVYDLSIPTGKTIYLNISEIIRAKKIIDTDLRDFEVNLGVRISYEENPELLTRLAQYKRMKEPRDGVEYYVHDSFSMRWSDWPEYNEAEDKCYDMTDTMTYIELKVPHYQQNQESSETTDVENTENTVDADVEASVEN